MPNSLISLFPKGSKCFMVTDNNCSIRNILFRKVLIMKISNFILVVLISLVFLACSSTKEEPLSISDLSTTELFFESAGGTEYITFSTTSNWSLEIVEYSSDDTGWCHLSSNSGEAGKNKVAISALINNKNVVRWVIIRLSCAGNSISLKITQTNSDILVISQLSYEIGCEGDTISIMINPIFDSYSDSICETAKQWIKKRQSSNNKMCSYVILENDSQEDRYGSIVFSCDGFSQTVSIKQRKSDLNSPYSYDFKVNKIYYKVTSIDKFEVAVVGGKNVYAGSVIIPDVVDYKGKTFKVTEISGSAFRECMITDVVIGKNVTKIGENAFYGCEELKQFSLPPSIKYINYSNLFRDCHSLKTFIIQDSEEPLVIKLTHSVGGNMPPFDLTVESFYMGRDIEFTGYTVNNRYNPLFTNVSNVKTVTIGNKVTYIPNSLFHKMAFTELTIPSNIKSIKDGAFDECFYLKKIQIADGKDEIELGRANYLSTGAAGGGFATDHLFTPCKALENIYLGRNLSYSPFQYCPIKSIIFGPYVTVAPGIDSKYLQSIEFHDGIQEIGYYSGNALMTIKCNRSTPPLASGFSNSSYVNATLFVPKGSEFNYSNADVWKNFLTIKAIE